MGRSDYFMAAKRPPTGAAGDIRGAASHPNRENFAKLRPVFQIHIHKFKAMARTRAAHNGLGLNGSHALRQFQVMSVPGAGALPAPIPPANQLCTFKRKPRRFVVVRLNSG
jgi:hypothetical protein